MHRRGREALAMLALQPLDDLGQRDVLHFGRHREDRRPERLDPARAPVAALRPRRRRARSQPEPPPLHRRRRRDPEPFRRRTAAHPGVYGVDHAPAKIKGKRSRHQGRPPLRPQP